MIDINKVKFYTYYRVGGESKKIKKGLINGRRKSKKIYRKNIK